MGSHPRITAVAVIPGSLPDVGRADTEKVETRGRLLVAALAVAEADVVRDAGGRRSIAFLGVCSFAGFSADDAEDAERQALESFANHWRGGDAVELVMVPSGGDIAFLTSRARRSGVRLPRLMPRAMAGESFREVAYLQVSSAVGGRKSTAAYRSAGGGAPAVGGARGDLAARERSEHVALSTFRHGLAALAATALLTQSEVLAAAASVTSWMQSAEGTWNHLEGTGA